MKINGEVIKEMPTSLGTFKVYKVKVKGGPCDGLEALAMNTNVVYVEGHVYRLNTEGDFVYDSGQVEGSAGSGKTIIPKSPV